MKKLPLDRQRAERITIRLLPEEAEAIRDAAEDADLRLSRWVREVLMIGASEQISPRRKRAARRESA